MTAGCLDHFRNPMTTGEGRIDPFGDKDTRPLFSGHRMTHCVDASLHLCRDGFPSLWDTKFAAQIANAFRHRGKRARTKRNSLRLHTGEIRSGDGTDLAQILRDNDVRPQCGQERTIHRIKRFPFRKS